MTASECSLNPIKTLPPTFITMCTCKKSDCLKLYCNCFASGNSCNENCRCSNCRNDVIHGEERNEAVGSIDGSMKIFTVNKKKLHRESRKAIKGCQCRKTQCLKKYCECYQANKLCTLNCGCIGCRNTNASVPMEVVIKPSAAYIDGSILRFKRKLLEKSSIQKLEALKPIASIRPIKIKNQNWVLVSSITTRCELIAEQLHLRDSVCNILSTVTLISICQELLKSSISPTTSNTMMTGILQEGKDKYAEKGNDTSGVEETPSLARSKGSENVMRLFMSKLHEVALSMQNFVAED